MYLSFCYCSCIFFIYFFLIQFWRFSIFQLLHSILSRNLDLYQYEPQDAYFLPFSVERQFQMIINPFLGCLNIIFSVLETLKPILFEHNQWRKSFRSMFILFLNAFRFSYISSAVSSAGMNDFLYLRHFI